MACPVTDLLIEQAVSAWRPRSADDSLVPHAAWADLPPDERLRLFEETLRCGALERALDEEALSGTYRLNLSKIESG